MTDSEEKIDRQILEVDQNVKNGEDGEEHDVADSSNIICRTIVDQVVDDSTPQSPLIVLIDSDDEETDPLSLSDFPQRPTESSTLVEGPSNSFELPPSPWCHFH
jgi:hypothetical protein